MDDKLIILLEGTVRLESATGEYLDTMSPLRVIGEMGVFTGQLRSSRVVANAGAHLLAIPADELDNLLDEDGQFAHHLFGSLIKLLYTRLHDINSEVAELHNKVDQLKGRISSLSPNDPILTELFPD